MVASSLVSSSSRDRMTSNGGSTTTGTSHGLVMTTTVLDTARRTSSTSTTTTMVDQPAAVDLVDRLSWVLYQGQYWWPAVIYQDYKEYLLLLRDELKGNALAKVALNFLKAACAQPHLGDPKSVRLARLLGQPLSEFVLLPPQQEGNDYQNCRNFFVHLGEIVSLQACKPDKIPTALYLDFHRGLDEAIAVLESSTSTSTSSPSTRWLLKAEEAAATHRPAHAAAAQEESEDPANRSPIPILRQPQEEAEVGSPAAASVGVVSVSESYVSASGRSEKRTPATHCTETPRKRNGTVTTTAPQEEESHHDVSTPTQSSSSPRPVALDGSPIPPHATWTCVWEKLMYNGWSMRMGLDGGRLYSPPPTIHGHVESWTLEQVQEYARKNYEWNGGPIRREVATQGQAPVHDESPISDNDKNRTYYDFKFLWEVVLKPQGWKWVRVTGKLNKLWLLDYVVVRPECSFQTGQEGRDFFKTTDDVVQFCKKHRYHKEYPYDTDAGSSCDSEAVGSDQSEAHEDNMVMIEEEEEEQDEEDVSGDSELEEEEEEEQECSSQEDEEDSSVNNEPMESEEEESEQEEDARYLTPPDSKTTPQDPSLPLVASPSDGSCSSQQSSGKLSEKSFGEIWEYLRHCGWHWKKARNNLEDYWYVKPEKSTTDIEGVDYFRSPEALVEYLRQEEEGGIQGENANRPASKTSGANKSASKLQRGRKRANCQVETNPNTKASKRAARSLGSSKAPSPKPEKPKFEVKNILENDAPWAILPPTLKTQKSFHLCQRIGAKYIGGCYCLPNASSTNDTARFTSLDELQIYFCREGIPNLELLEGEEDDNVGYSSKQVLQHWVDYTDIPKCATKLKVALETMRLIADEEASELLVKLGFSVSGIGKGRKWKSPVPLYFLGNTETEFSSLSRLRLFLRGVTDVEKTMASRFGRRSRDKIQPKLEKDELLVLRLWAAAVESPLETTSSSGGGNVIRMECDDNSIDHDISKRPSASSPQGNSSSSDSVQIMECDDGSIEPNSSDPTAKVQVPVPHWRSMVDELLSNVVSGKEAWPLLKKVGFHFTSGSYRLPQEYIEGELKMNRVGDLTSIDAVRQFLCLHKSYHVLLDNDAVNNQEKQQLYVWIETTNASLRSWTSLENVATLSDEDAIASLRKAGLHRTGDHFFLADVDPSSAINGVNCFQDIEELRAFIRAAEDLERAFIGGSDADGGRRSRHLVMHRKTEPLWTNETIWELRLWSLASLNPSAFLRVAENAAGVDLETNEEFVGGSLSATVDSAHQTGDLVQDQAKSSSPTRNALPNTDSTTLLAKQSQSTPRVNFTNDFGGKEQSTWSKPRSNFDGMLTQPDSGDDEDDDVSRESFAQTESLGVPGSPAHNIEPAGVSLGQDESITEDVAASGPVETEAQQTFTSNDECEFSRVSLGQGKNEIEEAAQPIERDGVFHDCVTHPLSHDDVSPQPRIELARVSLGQDESNVEDFAVSDPAETEVQQTFTSHNECEFSRVSLGQEKSEIEEAVERPGGFHNCATHPVSHDEIGSTRPRIEPARVSLDQDEGNIKDSAVSEPIETEVQETFISHDESEFGPLTQQDDFGF